MPLVISRLSFSWFEFPRTDLDFTMQTIATFSDGLAANLAKGRLAEAGIRVYLADEQTVGLAWHLTNAIGGIKLQVADEDVEQARAVLVEERNDEPENRLEAIEEERVSNDRSASDEIETTSTSRELNADRAFRGALFALLLFPLELYVFWLLIKVLVSDDNSTRADDDTQSWRRSSTCPAW